MKEWRKVPSVTTGGKAFFYQLIEEGRVTRSIVWDRRVQAYAVRDETVNVPGGLLLSYVSSVSQGKRRADGA